RQRDQHIGVLIENIKIVRRKRPRLVETAERLRRALERMQRLTEIAPGSGRARIGFNRGAEQALRFADLTLLQLDRTEKIERVEIVRHSLEHTAVDFFRLAQLALALQRDRFVERLSDIERPRIHSRLIRAMRRVTSAGVALSESVFNFSAARAAGRSRQHASQFLRCGHGERSMSMARLMTAATLRSATVKFSPSRYGCAATAASSTLNGAATTLSASSRSAGSRSAGGSRTACSDQILTPRSTSAIAQTLQCQARASPPSVAG